ncbi:predicted protein [Uncinocarpus reesii 1704]|uniref:Uncharacterized protein n=1 Tax=Uncinocarpus reesii (strain UAMH 1704) TaxID=336963 RepID=C4JSY3_UNCRE|nr:uncharacterized protein UREG_05572 [Uncinocarpus reesii 1704]EEP80730.1 predicted protein [Uncinocarpus reesii 1704]
MAPQGHQVNFETKDVYQAHILLPLQRDFALLSQQGTGKLRHLNSLISNLDPRIQPPSGVPLASIQNVEACFEFTLSSSEISPLLQDANQSSLCTTNTTAVQYPERRPMTDYMLDCDMSEITSNLREDWVSLDGDSPFSSQSSISSSSSIGSNRAAYSNTSNANPPGKMVQHYVSLLDSGLRSFLCHQFFQPESHVGRDLQTQMGILPSLASHALNANYNRAISQRATFIPVIARGIHSLLSSTRSPVLKSKLDNLKHIYWKTYGPQNTVPTGEATDDPNTRTILKCLLWTTMQHGLHCSHPASKLSPLTTDQEVSQTAPAKADQPVSDPQIRISASAQPLGLTDNISHLECLFDTEAAVEEDYFIDPFDNLETDQFFDELLEINQPSSPMLDDNASDKTAEFIDRSPQILAEFTDSDPILGEEDDDYDDLMDIDIDIDSCIAIDSTSSSNIACLTRCIDNEEMLF